METTPVSIRTGLIVLLMAGCAGGSHAAEYCAAPGGKSEAAGTKEAPWDIASAFEGKHAVKPGDTLDELTGILCAPPLNVTSEAPV